MKKEIIIELKDKIERLLGQERLRDALALLRTLSEGSMNWELSRQIEQAEDHYRLMLKYAAQGTPDPERGRMTSRLKRDIRQMADMLLRLRLAKDEPTLYYNTLRYQSAQGTMALPQLVEAYVKLADTGSLFETVAAGKTAQERTLSATQRQELERQLFDALWVEYPLSADLTGRLAQLMADEMMPDTLSPLLSGALLLGGLEFYDPRRLEILAQTYATATNAKAQIAALTALLLLLDRWHHQEPSEALRQRLEAARELPSWHDDLRQTVIELVRTRDTERITRKIRDEIVPQMLKLRPEIERKFGSAMPDPEALDMEENPDWQEMLDKSGISEQLRQMSEIQEQGGDVMVATFSHLKSFPFFQPVAHWFTPFSVERTELPTDMGTLLELLHAMPILCDSDKYSMAFAYEQVPPQQRELFMGQLQQQAEQMAEAHAAMLNPDSDTRHNIINKQVQHLYRFFTLFRRKGEFYNPFARGLSLTEVALLQPDVDAELQWLVAEFYFSHGYYPEALAEFQRIARGQEQPSAALLQKMGYAQQKTGNTAEALELYRRAAMLEEPGVWLLRRLARCSMQIGDFKEALTYYQKLEQLQPQSATVALSLANCLLQNGQTPQARKAYFKADYLQPDNPKTLRPLAWCHFLERDFEQAQRRYTQLASLTTLTPGDYLNLGHLALATGDYRQAMNHYALSLNSRAGSSPVATPEQAEAFIADMRADIPALRQAGIDTSQIPMLIDATLYGPE